MMINAVYRSILHYYMALSMSAGVVAPLPWTLSLDGPAPIVRKYVRSGTDRWDPRETILVGGRVAIVTQPLKSDRMASTSIVLQN